MALASFTMWACDTPVDTPIVRAPMDTVRTDTLATLLVPRPPPPAWRMEEAGPLLAIAGVTPRTAVLVLPEYADSTLHELPGQDLSDLLPLEVELFARRGKVGDATLMDAQQRSEDGCLDWPRAELRPPDGRLAESWTVALASGVATGVPLDSIEGLASADSARLAADVTRLASTAPGDTTTALDGIPFVVRAARRFTIDERTQGLVALVGRQLASEATPLVEHVFLVAERPIGQARATWRHAHVERAIGTDVTVETTEVLAVVRLGASLRLSMIVARDYGSRFTYSLLERAGAGRWVVRWGSAGATC